MGPDIWLVLSTENDCGTIKHNVFVLQSQQADLVGQLSVAREAPKYVWEQRTHFTRIA